MRISNHTTKTLTDNDGNEFELQGNPVDGLDPTVLINGDTAYVGYLQHDSDCANPLEDCDGMGRIWHHPSSRYGRREDRGEYYQALGLDNSGGYRYDNASEPATAILQAWVESLSAEDMLAILRCYALDADTVYDKQGEELRVALQRLDAQLDWGLDDYTDEAVKYVMPYQDRKPNHHVDLDGAQLPELNIDWEALAQQYPDGDRDAVLLDRFEHGQCRYSVSSNRVDWDLSKGEAVWVPDASAREEIERRAPVYAVGHIEEFQLRGPRKLRYHAIADVGVPGKNWSGNLGSFEHWHEAFEELQKFAEGVELTPEMQTKGRNRAAIELAEQACQQYTDWCNGNCYGYTVERHTRADADSSWEFVEEVDSCWGYVGGDYAESVLAEAMEQYKEKN